MALGPINLNSLLSGINSSMFSASLPSKIGGPATFKMDDSVLLTAAGMQSDKPKVLDADDVDATTDKPQVNEDRDKFDQAFTNDVTASLFTQDPSKLSDTQMKDLNNLLYTIKQENDQRKEDGGTPLSKDEVNNYLKQKLNPDELQDAGGAGEVKGLFSKDNDTEGTLGQTLKDLGLEELSDEQMENINKALEQYEKGEKITSDKDKDENIDEANEAGGSNSAGGANAAGGAGAVNPTNATNDASAADAPKFADNLEGLQKQKSETQAKIGELSGKIDEKQAAINDRKEAITSETGTKGLGYTQAREQRQLQGEHDEARSTFEKQRTEKSKVQSSANQTNQSLANTQTSLYSKIGEKQTKSSERAAAEKQLAALGNDEASQSKRAELQQKVSTLKQEENSLKKEITNLQSTEKRLKAAQAQEQAKIAECDKAMKAAQSTMNEKMEGIVNNNSAIKEAIEEDQEIQSLQSELTALKKEKAEQEQFLKEIDAHISQMEKQDESIQKMRQDQTQKDFSDALAAAGDPTVTTRELHEGLHADVTKEKTSTEALEWARAALLADPNDEKAKAVMETGTAYLEQKLAGADNALMTALVNLPDSVKDEATEYVQKAIEKADAKGTSLDDAARKAAADYVTGLRNKNLSKADHDKVEEAITAANEALKAKQSYDHSLECSHDAEFYQAIEGLSGDAREEALALRDSIIALSQEGAQTDLNNTYVALSEYLEEHPDENLDMATAKSMFGEYAPIALQGMLDSKNGEKIADQIFGNEQTAGQFDNDGSFSGDITALYHDAIMSLANERGDMQDLQKQYGGAFKPAIDIMDGTQAGRILGSTYSEEKIKSMSKPKMADFMGKTSQFGEALANASLYQATHYTSAGYCYGGVCAALARVGVYATGASAYMATEYLDKSEHFVRVDDVPKDMLNKLPRGTVVVYGKGSGYPPGTPTAVHGHIYVSQGDGRETSDHVEYSRPELFGDEYYVYFAVD